MSTRCPYLPKDEHGLRVEVMSLLHYGHISQEEALNEVGCSRSTFDTWILRHGNELKRMSPAEDSLKCSFCERYFRGVSSRSSHERQIHLKGKNVCIKCKVELTLDNSSELYTSKYAKICSNCRNVKKVC